ncbi:VanZ family protein [Heyndrickxia ginsengihumi]|uniref:VanZ family protein n=1 Tax=Heyndrickxia ginsengihumi TaxID=363870 RepID=UPI00046F8413|nr:VanZ family protein [Heyndrickxia ginsengihumi]
MNQLLFSLIFWVLPILLIYLMIRLLVIKRQKLNAKKECLKVFSIVYIAYLVYIVWLKPTAQLGYIDLNFVPFKTIGNYTISLINHSLPYSLVISNLFGNILLLLPLGLLFPLYFKRISFKSTVITGIIIPLLIEVGQLGLYLFRMGTRTVDIDDVILNFIGFMLGFYIMKIGLMKTTLKNSVYM